jgi:hypothetical protein
MARQLDEAGHSHLEAATPQEAHRLLSSQRFDLLLVKLRDERDADDVERAMDGVTLPPHTIVLGHVSAPPVALKRRRGGTLRFVPGLLPPQSVGRLVDLSISIGSWEEGALEYGTNGALEEIDLEDAIERAAALVRGQANRKRQRFNAVISGATHAFGNPTRLRQALSTLLRLVVSLAPYGSLVSVDAQAGRDEWLIQISASGGRRGQREITQIAAALREDSKKLSSVARALKDQGGMLWAELAAPGRLGFALTLPLPPEAARSVSA